MATVGAQGYGTCERTSDSHAVGAGPADQSCTVSYTCTGGDLRIECYANDDQTETCTCHDAADAEIATCDRAQVVDCESTSGCCFALVN